MTNLSAVNLMGAWWNELEMRETSRLATSRRLGISWFVRKSTSLLGRFYDTSQEVYRFILPQDIYKTDTGVSHMVAATYSTRFVQPTDFPQDAVGEIPLPQGSNSYGRSVCTGRLYIGVVYPLLMASLTKSKILAVANNASSVSLLTRYCEYIPTPKNLRITLK